MIRGEQESCPDVKAAGHRDEDEEYDFGPDSWATAPLRGRMWYGTGLVFWRFFDSKNLKLS